LTLACTDIGTLLALTNHRLTDDRQANLFVTVLLVELDARNRSLACCGAGHCPGFVLDRNGRTKAVLASDAPPLGIDPRFEFPTRRDIELQPQDLIFLYTDGVVDAGVPYEHTFGIERALTIVRTHQHETPDEILEALFEAARAFSQAPLHDDLTAVVIKVGEPLSRPVESP
jgi:phosphoserine phosphatase RsbU/P